jgi:ATP-dependent DNA ligase
LRSEARTSGHSRWATARSDWRGYTGEAAHRHRHQPAHRDEDGGLIFQQACKMGLEGIVSKRLSAPYRSGPSRNWIKVKNPKNPAMIRAREAEW